MARKNIQFFILIVFLQAILYFCKRSNKYAQHPPVTLICRPSNNAYNPHWHEKTNSINTLCAHRFLSTESNSNYHRNLNVLGLLQKVGPISLRDLQLLAVFLWKARHYFERSSLALLLALMNQRFNFHQPHPLATLPLHQFHCQHRIWQNIRPLAKINI